MFPAFLYETWSQIAQREFRHIGQKLWHLKGEGGVGGDSCLFFRGEADVDGLVGYAAEHHEGGDGEDDEGYLPRLEEAHEVAVDEGEDVMNEVCHLHGVHACRN